MTLTLTPETEEQLTAVAAQRGLSPEEALAQVLVETRAEFNDAVAGLRQSMAEIKAGHWVALEDFEKELDEHIRRRRSDERK